MNSHSVTYQHFCLPVGFEVWQCDQYNEDVYVLYSLG